MKSARGDSQPCTASGCGGTMQFRRESDNEARRPERPVPASTLAGEDRLGWMCGLEPDHFQYEQLARRPDRRTDA
jgi:hypothetical protein